MTTCEASAQGDLRGEGRQSTSGFSGYLGELSLDFPYRKRDTASSRISCCTGKNLTTHLSKLIQRYRVSKKKGSFEYNFFNNKLCEGWGFFSEKVDPVQRFSHDRFFSTPSIPYLHPAGFLEVSPLEKRRAKGWAKTMVLCQGFSLDDLNMSQT